MDARRRTAASWFRYGRACPCCAPDDGRALSRLMRARFKVATRREIADTVTDGGR